MVGPISVNGPASGIDTSAIIQKLISLQTAPEQVYQNDISIAQAQQNALLQVNVGLLAVKSATDQLQLPSLFDSTALSSSNSGALSATSTGIVSAGVYTFQVAKLAQANQLISNGFPDSGTTAVTSAPATLSIQMGGGSLAPSIPVSFLNGQTGFDRGSIRITDSRGSSALVDLSGAETVQDIVSSINSASSVSVRASLQGNGIVLQDLAGGTGTLLVTDAGGTQTATSLGIAGSGVSIGGTQVIEGSDINQVTGTTPLAILNGGLGVRLNRTGQPDFTISGGTGASAFSVNVTLGSADTTLGQVLSDINAAGGSNVSATLNSQGNAIVLSSSVAGGLALTPSNGSFAAVDLGLGTISGSSFVPNAVEDSTTGQVNPAGNRIVGNALAPSLDGIQRSLLNGGQTNLDPTDVKGVADGSITLTDRAGNTATVNLSASVDTTVTAAAGAGATSLTLGTVNGLAVGNEIRIQTSAGIEYRTVTGLNAGTDAVTLNQALVGSVASGAGAVGINASLADIVRTLNQAASDQHVGIQVGLNSAQDGLEVTDLTQGTGTLSVAEVAGGQTAADLGIAGSSATGTIAGANLHPQYLGESTLLSTLGGGQGVSAGTFQVTDTQGKEFTVNLSQPDTLTLGAFIRQINVLAQSAGSGVVARVNDTGNGVLLVDTTPGSGTLQVQDLSGGQTASDLQIAGTAPSSTPAQIDGSFEHTISIDAGSTLQSVVDAVNGAGIGVTASLLNDGSGTNAFHLLLTSQTPGQAGQLTVDSTIPGLTFATSAAAQNAVVVYGGSGGSAPIAVTSSTNSLSGVVPGMTLQLKGVTSSPVTISAAPDTGGIATEIQSFVTSYNSVLATIQSTSNYDPTAQTAGVLFGNSALQSIRSQLASLITTPVAGIPAGQLNTLASVGITFGQQGTLSLDQSVLNGALQSNLSQVANLFTEAKKLDPTTPLSALNSGAGVTGSPGPDFTVTAMDGTSFTVSLGAGKSMEDLLLAIDTAAGNTGKVTAGISSDGFSLQLTDHTGGTAGALQVQDTGSSNVAAELGIEGMASAGQNVLKGSVLTLSGSPGVGAQLSSALNFITEPGDGILAVQSSSLTTKINGYQSQIDNLNSIASQMEISLVKEFANLEAVISSSETTSQELAAILGTTTSSGSSTSPSIQSILGSNTAPVSTNIAPTTSSSGSSSTGSGTGSTGSSGSSGSGSGG